MRAARSLTLMIIVFMTILPAASAANRLVVAELYTAQNCPYCAFADPQLGQVYEANRGSIAVVAFHPLDYNGETDPMGIGSTEDRMSNYGVEGYPTVIFDGGARVVGGHEDVGDEYRQELVDRLKIEAPLKLKIGVEEAAPTLKIWVNGTPEEDIFNDTELSVVLVQDHVEYDGENGLDDFRFVARGLRTKDVSVLEGESFSIRFSFTINSRPDDLSVIAFVQDVVTGEIYQGAQKSVSGLSNPTDSPEDKGSGSDGMSSMEAGLIGLVALLGAVGIYLFIDDRRGKAKASPGRRSWTPPKGRGKPSRNVPEKAGRPKQRGKKGRSKKRKRHR